MSTISLDDAVLPVHTEGQTLLGDCRTSDHAKLVELAVLSPLDYDRKREAAAKAMGVRTATLDKMVIAIRTESEVSANTPFETVTPWPDPVDAAGLLAEIAATVRRFIVCTPATANGAALWSAMTWFMDVTQVAPIAAITAPEKRCGKSQLLFVLGKLSRRPLAASNISPAALYRAIEEWHPTLIIDEADAFMRENEELRGILNSGHTRDTAYVVRVVGEDMKVRRFSTWGAKAIAGIGTLADTLMDRAIKLELRRKLPGESVDRLRHADPDLFTTLAEKLARFAEDNVTAVRTSRPALPAALHDRAQDNWEPLLAIAAAAGGEWPKLAMEAAIALSGETLALTGGAELLADIRTVFDIRNTERLTTAALLDALCSDEEAPWATYSRGRPMTPRQLSRKLDAYGIQSKNVRADGRVAKGFERNQFEDAFARYLESSCFAATPLQASKEGASSGDVNRYGSATKSKNPLPLQNPPATGRVNSAVACSGFAAPVAASVSSTATLQPNNDGPCSGVADFGPVFVAGAWEGQV